MLAMAECKPGMLALDIGCGNGVLVASASSQGVRAFGVDASHQIVTSAARMTGNDAFLQGTADRLPVRSESVDRIFSQHLIEHVRDPNATMAEWHRALKSGGRLIVLTPNALYPDPGVFSDPTHLRIFDARTLRALLARASFHGIRLKTLFPHLRGNTVFGLRWRKLFSALPPWATEGRSLLAVADKSVRADH